MTDQGFTSTYHLAGGISAWLVESHNVPLMALRFVQAAFGKEGA